MIWICLHSFCWTSVAPTWHLQSSSRPSPLSTTGLASWSPLFSFVIQLHKNYADMLWRWMAQSPTLHSAWFTPSDTGHFSFNFPQRFWHFWVFRVTWAVLPWSIALLAWLPNLNSIVHMQVTIWWNMVVTQYVAAQSWRYHSYEGKWHIAVPHCWWWN